MIPVPVGPVPAAQLTGLLVVPVVWVRVGVTVGIRVGVAVGNVVVDDVVGFDVGIWLGLRVVGGVIG